MKRLLFIASLAILAASCQKTTINAVVEMPIGFSSEVGKQTRAIVSGTEYLTDQPFGVYAYGHQEIDDVDVPNENPIMANIEVSYTAAKWAASGTTKYYWPNDPRTTINFYAYSPATGTSNQKAAVANHQKLSFVTGQGNAVTHNETDGLKLVNYDHKNMYVDFMVAAPVIGATYSDQDGEGSSTSGLTSVPVSFAHKMTQVNFTVKIADQAEYPEVNFTVKSIVLNDIVSEATYSYNNEKDNDNATLAWAPGQATSAYQVFPATTDPTEGNDAPALVNPAANNIESDVVLHTDDRDNSDALVTFSTTPVTMIPQALDDQSFTITYQISGTGVATETVVKTFDLAGNNLPAWAINKKITYVLTVGLNEITFAPVVVDWDSTNAGGDYNI